MVSLLAILSASAFRENWALFSIVGYFLLFTASVLGFAIWRVKRYRVRPPLEFKLLRGPGETLRRQMAAYDENMLFHMGGAAFAPPLIAGGVFLAWMHWFKPTSNVQAVLCLGISGALFLIVLVLSFRWALKDFYQYRNDRLGYLGERAVAEELAPLERQGYRVFHDMPAEAGERKFNIDHIVVGPTGVFAIETKTRRKGRAREGFKDHEVSYDGRQLIWPWGEDQHGLNQAEAQARWLAEWLNKRTGFGIEVRPMLALPGWMVKEQKIGPVRVLNAKNVPSAIVGRNVRVLSTEQIDLIARQIDDKCRDVED
jgi:hypothetical protein